ncbi:ECF transporter S component [Methanosphaera sp.]|uniref:ECF transporter S component n=1 Tax=Methanosphaera sp. TaxID=2666342 RepID=UPI0026E0322C|nr:ECF transporter S component [Methanosphaera sp.]MDO5822342.1 ECF transporter S component [Methanosphaera sp.]
MELMNILTLIISLLVAVGFIGVIFRMFEKSKPSVEYIVMLAVLIAISVVANFIGSILHIDLVFFIVIMAGVVFGKESGFLVGALSIIVFGLISGAGIGTWTPYQMIGFGLLGYTSGLFANKMESLPFRAVFGLLWGFIYGWITNISWFYFVPISVPSIISTYTASIFYDASRGICTLILLVIAYTWFKEIFQRNKEKYQLE